MIGSFGYCTKFDVTLFMFSKEGQVKCPSSPSSSEGNEHFLSLDVQQSSFRSGNTRCKCTVSWLNGLEKKSLLSRYSKVYCYLTDILITRMTLLKSGACDLKFKRHPRKMEYAVVICSSFIPPFSWVDLSSSIAVIEMKHEKYCSVLQRLNALFYTR